MRIFALIALLVAFTGVGAAGETPIASTVAYYPEGPLWRESRLYFAEMAGDRISIWEDRAVVTFWKRAGCGPTSISSYRTSDFIVLCHLEGVIVQVDERGRTIKVLERDIAGMPLGNPNDSSSDGSGGVYFSDSGRFQAGADAEGSILHIAPGGQVRRLVKNLAYANGVYFDPPTRQLYVSEHLGRRVLRFPVLGDGGLDRPVTFADFNVMAPPARYDYPESGPDGIEIDRQGRVWIAEYGQGRILVFSPDGQLLRSIEFDTPYLTNVAIGGGDRIAFTGAYTNRVFPFRGLVTVMPFDDAAGGLLSIP